MTNLGKLEVKVIGTKIGKAGNRAPDNIAAAIENQVNDDDKKQMQDERSNLAVIGVALPSCQPIQVTGVKAKLHNRDTRSA